MNASIIAKKKKMAGNFQACTSLEYSIKVHYSPLASFLPSASVAKNETPRDRIGLSRLKLIFLSYFDSRSPSLQL